MSWIVSYARSSIGGKHIMAVTGLAIVLFLIVHMVGNLLLFAGPDALNSYAVSLRKLGPLLWVARIGLAVCFIAHIWAAFRLNAMNREARPVGYREFKTRRTTLFARAMMVSGVILLAFVLYHLAHATFHLVHADNSVFVDAQGRHDVYKMMVLSFQNPLISGFYILAMAILCMHLWHAIPSLFQSLGLRHPRYQPAIEKLAPLIAGPLFVGNIAMPIAVLAGIVQLSS